MKKYLVLSIILIGLVTLVGPVAGVSAQEGEPEPLVEDVLTEKLYLPLITTFTSSFQVSGQIKDAQDQPLSGVTVSNGNGATAVTDDFGFYSLNVPYGAQEFTASKTAGGGSPAQCPFQPWCQNNFSVAEGYNFDPGVVQLDVDQNIDNLDFTALLACGNAVQNPSFEINPFYWNPIGGFANGYTPYYTTDLALTGIYSGATGIKPGEENKPSWSRWRSHEIFIPVGSTSANLSLWMWPQTTEVVFDEPVKPFTPPVGFNADAIDESISAELPDMQYIAVLDAATNTVLGYLYTTPLLNDQAWLWGNFNLLAYAGQVIKIEFGVFNDGLGGVTSAYFDEIVVDVCPLTVSPTCTNYLVNSTFEGFGGWISQPANIPSVYTTEYAYSPIWSMLNGLSVFQVNPFPGIVTTSEVIQPVTIPLGAYYAHLRVRLLPRSTQYAADLPLDQLDMSDAYDPSILAQTESQYAFIMDPTGTTSHRMLFKWFADDSLNWLVRDFDLFDFRGQNISVLFGAGNDGLGGNTGLYVDDANLIICQ